MSNIQNEGIFIKKGVKFRILAISWEISNTLYSKSLKPLYQMISWGKWMTEAKDMSQIYSKGPKVCQNIQDEGIFIKKGVKFRILAISWEISNTTYSISLKSLYQLISWGKWMAEAIVMSQISSKGPKVCQNIWNKGIFIKRGVKFRILAISWEISNTIYLKSLRPVYQMISRGK